MDTKITYEQVKKAAEDVKGNATTMNTLFDDFKSVMKALTAADVFAGLASDELEAKFSQLKTQLMSYVQKVENFSSKISTAGQQTEDTERRIQQRAAELPDITV